ncbi:MAG: VOC family protein [Bdellovibrio sp.]|nr:VOC family protein [Bdellovibrio sp.]
MTKLSHIDLNVSDYAKSIRFYDLILLPLGWKRLTCRTDHTTYTDGTMKLCICPTEEKYLAHGFHRKKTGLNHLAFYANSKSELEVFHKDVLQKNDVPTLYEKGPYGDDDYYAVYFEDPDRMKIEVVFSPTYCHADHWTNSFEDNFDPYK